MSGDVLFDVQLVKPYCVHFFQGALHLNLAYYRILDWHAS